MNKVTITKEMMDSIELCVVDDGDVVFVDEETNISTIEYNNQKFWFNSKELDDDNLDFFEYDVTWEGIENGEDEGVFSYSVSIGDVVEYHTAS